MDTISIFRRVRKVAKSDCYLSVFVCPHVRMEHLGSLGRIFVKWW
jgi:hypothetical protein